MVRLERTSRKTMAGFTAANLPQSELGAQSDVQPAYHEVADVIDLLRQIDKAAEPEGHPWPS
jgi:hypothetical protein